MKKWTKESLEAAGYTIENALIRSADLTMENNDMTLKMVLEGAGWACVYGGVCLGSGYDSDTFFSIDKAMTYVMNIMNTVGVANFNGLQKQYIRVAIKDWGESVHIIGNIIHDQWFDPDQHFAKDKEDSDERSDTTCKDTSSSEDTEKE